MSVQFSYVALYAPLCTVLDLSIPCLHLNLVLRSFVKNLANSDFFVFYFFLPFPSTFSTGILLCFTAILTLSLLKEVYNTIQYNGKFALKNWQTHCQFNLALKLKRTEMFKRKMKWEILIIEIVLNVKLTKFDHQLLSNGCLSEKQ